MRRLDAILQTWRARIASKHIPPAPVHLDVGCYDGRLFDYVDASLKIGLDKSLATDVFPNQSRVEFITGDLNGGLPLIDSSVDVVSMLAVYEHLEDKAAAISEIGRVLKPEGVVVLTVPSPRVDDVLRLMIALRLLDGMSFDEHHYFDPERVEGDFGDHNLRLVLRQQFQLGLNNLFLFRKVDPG